MNISSHPGVAQSTGNSKRKQAFRFPAPENSVCPIPWQWIAIGILAVVTFVLGYIGFWKNAASLLEPRTPLDVFYMTLQLFIMESGNVVGRVPWELEIARLIAPVVPAWTVIIAAGVLFRAQIQRFRMRWLRDHIVICGLSRLGLELARDARSTGRRVVVIEMDEDNDYLQSAADAGCSVILGDATDAAVLARARAGQAHSVMAVAGEDGINVAAAVALRDTISRMPSRDTQGPACYVHVTDPELCSLLQEHRPADDADLRLEVRFFNFYQDSVRLLLEEHPLDREPISHDDPRTVHLIIVGLGRMGQSLALEAARIGHYANGGRLRLSVLDLEAAARLKTFYGRHPQFNRVCDVQFKEGDIEERDMLDQIQRWAEDEKSLTTLAICLDGDAQAFSTALAISSLLAPTKTPVYVRLSDETGLASLISGHGVVGAWKTAVYSFGQKSSVCTLDKLFRSEQDALARAIHENFVIARAREGRASDDPSMRPWNTLTETLKSSNRQQADHIAVKLRAIGCRSVPNRADESHVVALTNDEVELLSRMEHARWNAERFLSGWIPGPKDIAKKASPYLVPWEDLTDSIREYDREAVRQIPHLLSLIGHRIERSTIWPKYKSG
ncbi:MAG: NAD-binding protein [Acidobacteria bacterium]|nr:NAD-binding protein [Acidobacteriota bacterium]